MASVRFYADFDRLDSTSTDPTVSGHVVLNNVNIVAVPSPNDVSAWIQQMVNLTGPDIQILNSTLTPTAKSAFTLNFADGALISGNSINLQSGAWWGIGSSQNQIFENNVVNGGTNPGGVTGFQSGGEISLSFCNPCRSQMNGNMYFGYNTVENMTNPDTQGFTTDGNNIAYYGKISNASGGAVTLSYQPDWSKTGNDNFQTLALSIINGTGAGQYRFVQSVNGLIVTLQQPFAVSPDSTSVLTLTQVEYNMIFAHNSFSNLLSDSISLFGDNYEVAIENNTMVNGGQGISVDAFGPYGYAMNYEPIFNVDVLNNSITGNAPDIAGGSFPSLATASSATGGGAGITLSALQGSAVSGLLVRGNTIELAQCLSWGDGDQNVISVLEENNNNGAGGVATQNGGIFGPSTSLGSWVRLQGINY